MSTSALAVSAERKHEAIVSVLDITYRPPRRPRERLSDLSLAAIDRDGSVSLWSRTDARVCIPDADLEAVLDIIHKAIEGRR